MSDLISLFTKSFENRRSPAFSSNERDKEGESIWIL